MIRLIGNTVKNKVSGVPSARVRLKDFMAGDLGGGMNTSLYSANLDDNQFQLLTNTRNAYGRLSRRTGLGLFSPAKPNSNPVLLFAAYVKSDGTVKLLRFTGSSIHAASTGSWTAITGSALTSPAHFQTVLLENRLFFADDGNDVIQEIDTTANTYAALGDAPKYKFITGFGDRLVGANLAGSFPNPTQVGWSGNRNYAEWNPITDNTAGSQIITDSSSDIADYITGVIGFSNVMVLLRERSVWNAIKTGSFSAPFQFYNVVPNQGCDSPYSVGRVPAGLAWLDTRTANVFFFGLDNTITPIGDAVRGSILNSVNDPKQVFGSYNPHNQLYTIAIPDNTSQVIRAWEFSFLTKTWSYDEYINISSISDLDYIGGSLTIDDLKGTIDQLTGTIDSLSPSVTAVTRFYGHKAGEISFENPTLDSDWNGAYTEQVVSKDYELPIDNAALGEIRIEYIPQLSGSFILLLSGDGGITYDASWTVSYSDTDLHIKKIATFKVNRLSRLVNYKITSTSGLVDLTRHELRIYDSADATK